MRIVILGSGRGTNAEAILHARATGRLGRAEVAAIFSDQPAAGQSGSGRSGSGRSSGSSMGNRRSAASYASTTTLPYVCMSSSESARPRAILSRFIPKYSGVQI